LVPAVVRWNEGALGEAAGRPVTDSRASVYVGDVADLIRRQKSRWDAILLDVDNGPSGLTKSDNDRLYSTAGLFAAIQALKPNGVLGVWSAAQDDAFTHRLERSGFATVEPVRVRARGAKGRRRHIVWICTR
jgi:spermidine synthase